MRVFVNALPKSGTNLLQKLFEHFGFNYVEFGISSASILGNNYYIRQFLRGSFFDKNPINIGFDAPVSISSNWLEKKISKVNTFDYFSGHVNFTDRFYNILNKNNIRTIHIIRDPRSVLLSHVKYFSEKKDYYLYNVLKGKTLEEKINITLKGGYFLNNTIHLESFYESLKKVDGWFNKNNVYIVRFEDLVGSKGGGDDKIQKRVINDILNFLELSNKFSAKDIDHISSELFGNTHTFRTGKIDSWKSELTIDLIEIIESELSYFLKKWKYK